MQHTLIRILLLHDGSSGSIRKNDTGGAIVPVQLLGNDLGTDDKGTRHLSCRKHGMGTLQCVQKAAACRIQIKRHHMLIVQTQLFLNQTRRGRGCLIRCEGCCDDQVNLFRINAGFVDCHTGRTCTKITRILFFRNISGTDSRSAGYPFVIRIDKGAQLLIGNAAFCQRIAQSLDATALHNLPPSLDIFHTALPAVPFPFSCTNHPEHFPAAPADARLHSQSRYARRPLVPR